MAPLRAWRRRSWAGSDNLSGFGRKWRWLRREACLVLSLRLKDSLSYRTEMMRKSRKESTAKLNQNGLTKQHLRFRVNGEVKEVATETNKTLLEVLREDLGLTGTKHGCELGECGTCTVLVDGSPVLSCLALPVELEDRRITKVEGMADGGRLHPLQQAFAELGAAQCGYCTPGILLTAQALLAERPTPLRQEIKEALAGNLCRCTGYTKILDAVELAAVRMTGGSRVGDRR